MIAMAAILGFWKYLMQLNFVIDHAFLVAFIITLL